MEAMAFIDKPGKGKPLPVYVVTGDEEFLKRRAIAALQHLIIGDSDPSLCVSTYPGDKAEFSALRNELDTLPFLSDTRLVIVEQADPFVTKFRSQLEKYVAEPSTRGILVLEVKTWTGTTKLAKAVPEAATIVGKSPPGYRLPAWCAQWSQSRYAKKLPSAAADLLVELVGPQMGMLDSELNKLAVCVGDNATITLRDVDQWVGRSRGSNVFRILDALSMGKSAEAMTILHELFEQNEPGIGILGALSAQLRRLVMTARLLKQGRSREDAMDEAGVQKWPAARESALKQLKHLGPERIDRLYDWLIEADLGMKGGSAMSETFILERLIARMAKPSGG